MSVIFLDHYDQAEGSVDAGGPTREFFPATYVSFEGQLFVFWEGAQRPELGQPWFVN